MKLLTALLFGLLISGCSLLADSKQEFTIAGNSTHSKVTVNDRVVKVPGSITVDTNKSLTVNAFDGDHLVFTKSVVPVASTWGKLDTMGVYFLFPGLGLFAPGSMELETNTVYIN